MIIIIIINDDDDDDDDDNDTLFQNGRHFRILLFDSKLALLASLSNVKFKRIFYLKRGQKGQFAIKQKNTKMVAILE